MAPRLLLALRAGLLLQPPLLLGAPVDLFPALVRPRIVPAAAPLGPAALLLQLPALKLVLVPQPPDQVVLALPVPALRLVLLPPGLLGAAAVPLTSLASLPALPVPAGRVLLPTPVSIAPLGVAPHPL